jgi:hypothetical protein
MKLLFKSPLTRMGLQLNHLATFFNKDPGPRLCYHLAT